MKNQKLLSLVLIVGIGGFFTSCAAPKFFTVTIYERSDQAVKLQTVSHANNEQGFSHPAFITTQQLTAVMRGLRVEAYSTGLSLPFINRSSPSGHQRAFSDREITFFAPLFAKALAQATPEELVTFYETADISDLYQLTTSGGLFVKGEVIHFLLSNHNVKTRIWQDNEQYESPYRVRPMEPIDPQSGRLLFTPPHLMVEPRRGILNRAFNAEPWHVGILFQHLPSPERHEK